jgi:hypothetical protein
MPPLTSFRWAAVLRRSVRRCLVPVLFVHVTLVTAALAQEGSAERLAGRVLGPTGLPVRGAEVFATQAPDRVTQQTITDASGQFAFIFKAKTGDYLLFVRDSSSRTLRIRITERDGRDLARLALVLGDSGRPLLAEVRVVARRPNVARQRADSVGPGESSSPAGSYIDALDPSEAGSFTALAKTLSAVSADGTLPGLDANSSQSQIAGLSFSGLAIPRGMRVANRVTLSTFDPLQGGAAGALTNIELLPGGETHTVSLANVFRPSAFGTHGTQARYVGAGGALSQVTLSGDGPLASGRWRYNGGMSIDHLRTASPALRSLATNEAQLLDVLRTRQMPTLVARDEGRTDISFLGRFEDIQRRDRIRGVTLGADAGFGAASSVGPNATPATRFEQRKRGGMIQANEIRRFGRTGAWQLNTSVGLQARVIESVPTLQGQRLLLRDTTDAGQAVTLVAGGSGTGARRLTTTGLQLLTELARPVRWNQRTFLVRSGMDLRLEQSDFNPLLQSEGVVAFESPAAFQAGRPQFVYRERGEGSGNVRTLNQAYAVGVSTLLRPNLSIIGGVRAEHMAAWGIPLVRQPYELLSQSSVSDVFVSPRIGFSWRLSGNGSPSRTLLARNRAGSTFRPPLGVLSGGFGAFRGILDSRELAVGSLGPTAISECASSDVVSADSVTYQCAPVVSGTADPLRRQNVAQDFSPRVSWRSNLSWTAATRVGTYKIEGFAARASNLLSTADALAPENAVFVLSTEQRRPVFVAPSAIQSDGTVIRGTTGQQSDGTVQALLLGSRIRSRTAGATVTVFPRLSYGRGGLRPAAADLSVSYSFVASRRVVDQTVIAPLGLDLPIWAPDPSVAAHTVVATGAWFGGSRVVVTGFLRASSGRPFTPLASTDLNGDGFVNDVAVIPVGDDRLRSELLQLRSTSAQRVVRRCVDIILGGTTRPNSCRGPVDIDASIRVGLRNPVMIRGRAAMVSAMLIGLPAGIDWLVHGAQGERGWGQGRQPSPLAIRPSAFSLAPETFQYQSLRVFASNRPSDIGRQTPFQIAVEVRLPLSTPASEQRARRLVGAGQSFDSIAFVRRSVARWVNPAAETLLESDTLLLSPNQIDTLSTLASIFEDRIARHWQIVSQRIAVLRRSANIKGVVVELDQGDDGAQAIVVELVASVNSVLSSGQVTFSSARLRSLLQQSRGVLIR